MNAYRMFAVVDGKEVASACFAAEEEEMKRLMFIFNLADWPASVKVTIQDMLLRRRGDVKPDFAVEPPG